MPPEEPSKMVDFMKSHGAPVFKRMESDKTEEKVAASSAIVMLQRRVRDMYVDIELPGGDVFKVRTSISREETQRIENLRREQAELGKPDVANLPRIDELRAEMVNLTLRTAEDFARSRAIQEDLDKLMIPSQEKQNRMIDCYLEIIGIISADRDCNGEWLKTHSDLFSMEDIFTINTAFNEQRMWQENQRQERIQQAMDFRTERLRPK